MIISHNNQLLDWYIWYNIINTIQYWA